MTAASVAALPALLEEPEARDVAWPEAETVDALPLKGHDGTVLGVLLISSSRRELSALVTRIR